MFVIHRDNYLTFQSWLLLIGGSSNFHCGTGSVKYMVFVLICFFNFFKFYKQVNGPGVAGTVLPKVLLILLAI